MNRVVVSMRQRARTRAGLAALIVGIGFDLYYVDRVVRLASVMVPTQGNRALVRTMGVIGLLLCPVLLVAAIGSVMFALRERGALAGAVLAGAVWMGIAWQYFGFNCLAGQGYG